MISRHPGETCPPLALPFNGLENLRETKYASVVGLALYTNTDKRNTRIIFLHVPNRVNVYIHIHMFFYAYV